MAKFSDQFRASAIAMLMSAGFATNKTRACNDIARYYKGQVNARTLMRWGSGENQPAPDKLVADKKEELADVFEDIAYKYLRHAGNQDVIDEVSGNAAVVTAATAVDKMRLLRGLPTEIIAIVPELIAALNAAGMDPVDTFNRMLQKAHERANIRSG